MRDGHACASPFITGNRSAQRPHRYHQRREVLATSRCAWISQSPSIEQRHRPARALRNPDPGRLRQRAQHPRRRRAIQPHRAHGERQQEGRRVSRLPASPRLEKYQRYRKLSTSIKSPPRGSTAENRSVLPSGARLIPFPMPRCMRSNVADPPASYEENRISNQVCGSVENA